jgi:peptidoglycan/LPS O-acetylase OafA/YrhL
MALAAYAVITSRGKPLLHYAPVSAVFAIVILNVAANPASLLKLRHPLFTLLGNMSYAMYLLHEIAIGAVMRMQVALTGTHYDTFGSKAALYVASVASTMAIAAIVYRYFELPFLRLKGRFAVVESGPEPPAGVPVVQRAEATA